MSSTVKRAWKEAATLIIAARSSSVTNGFDYKILCMKRSEKTSFLANNISYPGGAIEKQDESMEWLEHFKKFGVTERHLDRLKLPKEMQKAFIFRDREVEEQKLAISRSISLRISAIRETFEELGVLLYLPQPAESSQNFTKYFRGIDIKIWQKKVHSRSITFLDLCKNFNIIPDIFNIYEWSAWLTPTFFSKRRFETAFYICVLQDQPPVYPESIEADSFMWRTPEEYIQMLKSDEVWYHPPQFYEFSRLRNFKKINEIRDFMVARQNKGATLFMPVTYNCQDGLVFTLPKDDLYPKVPQFVEDLELEDRSVECSCEDFRKKGKNLNRIEIKAPSQAELFCNIEAFDGHLTPITDQKCFKSQDHVLSDTTQLKTKL